MALAWPKETHKKIAESEISTGPASFGSAESSATDRANGALETTVKSVAAFGVADGI